MLRATSECNTFTIGNNKGDSQIQVVAEDDGCDESKCVSTGLSHDGFNYSFTCYTENEYSPMICADGYQPQIVENEAIVYSNLYEDRPFYYFTCCPPNTSSGVNPSRHCSDSNTLSGLNNTMISCEENNRPYPRRMENYTRNYNNDLVESYICCDSIIDDNGNQTSSLLTF